MAAVMSTQLPVRKVLAHLAIGVAVGSGATAAFLAVKGALTDPAHTYSQHFYDALVREMKVAQDQQARERMLQMLLERKEIEGRLQRYRSIVTILPRTIVSIQQGAELSHENCVMERARVLELTEKSDMFDLFDAQIAKGARPGPQLRSAQDSVRENGIVQNYNLQISKACARYGR